MEQRKWFVLSQDQKVSGPFDPAQIEAQLPQLSGQRLWARGLTEWILADKWKKTVSEETQIQKIQKTQHERLWKIRVGDQELKPLTQNQMMDFLKTRHDLSEIQIWTEGYSEWKDVYQIHRIMDELGVSRRQHPRVPIMGLIQLEGASQNLQAKAQSLSEGGLGVTDAHKVKIGEKFKMVLKSANLFAPLHATVEVVYTSADGYAGMKFVGLPTDAKSAIIEYIKKFNSAN
jgi:hypothetical protein